MHKSQHKPKLLKSKKFQWLLGIVLILLCVYTLIGRYMAPNWITEQIRVQTRELLDSEFSFEQARLNPFALSLTLNEAQLSQSGQQWFAAQELYANLSLTDLLTGTITLSDIHLQKPEITLNTDADGQLITPQMPQTQSIQSEPPSSDPVTYLIEKLHIDSGAFTWNMASGQRIHIPNFSIDLTDFDHQQQLQDLTFELSTAQQGRIQVDLLQKPNQKTGYQGTFKLDNIQLQELAQLQLLPDDLDLLQGTVQASGGFDWPGDRMPALTLNQITFSATDFTFSETLQVTGMAAEVSQATIDLIEQQVRIDSVQTHQADILIYVIDSANETSTESTAQTWQVSIGHITGADHRLKVLMQEGTATPDLAITSFDIQDVSVNTNQSSPFQVQAALSNNSNVQLNGAVQLTPFSLSTELSVDQLSLPEWQSVLAGSAIQLDQGVFSGQATLNVTEQWVINAQGNVTDLSIRQQEKQIVGLPSAEIGSVVVDSQSKTVVVGCISAPSIQGQLPNEQSTVTDVTEEQDTSDSTWRVILSSSTFSQDDNKQTCNLSPEFLEDTKS